MSHSVNEQGFVFQHHYQEIRNSKNSLATSLMYNKETLAGLWSAINGIHSNTLLASFIKLSRYFIMYSKNIGDLAFHGMSFLM